MTPTELDVQHFDDGDHAAIMDTDEGYLQFVHSGPHGLETTIPFDFVGMGRRTITFYRRERNHGYLVDTGTIEKSRPIVALLDRTLDADQIETEAE